MFFREKEMKQWCHYMAKGNDADAYTYLEIAKHLSTRGYPDAWIKQYIKNTADMENDNEEA